jgi:2-aminoethylphosphonate-pyruvate transaminase
VHENAQVVAQCGRRFLIDAMSSFGALELDARTTPFDVLVASGNKCLEGVPGLAFAIARTEALECCAGNAPSLSLDLYDQWQTMERTGQWRFTPPTHVTAALHQALREHAAEGGIAARGARYRRNCRILVNGMRALGFTTYLPDALQAPIIVTFHLPIDPKFQFETFYDHMQRRGFVLYPGKLTSVPSFRMGCIGRISETEIRLALAAVSEVLKELGVAQCGPQYGPMRAAASGG